MHKNKADFHSSIQVTLLVISFVLLSACTATEYTRAEAEGAECVVLLHGLARSARSMSRIQHGLVQHGYTVLNLNYPSTEFPIEVLADQFLSPALKQLQACPKIHFVTHSMGGILLRYHEKQHGIKNIGRVVMLSPPNQGSELVDVMGEWALFRWLNGPAGQQLGTGDGSLPKSLGPVDFELAVITGNRSFNPIYSWLIPGADDGKVSVESARVEGMKLFKILPKTHTFIMQSKLVVQTVTQFIQNGHIDLLPNIPSD